MSRANNKQCPKCREYKDVSAFHKSKRADGTQAYCKVCRKKVDHLAWEKRANDPVKMATKKEQIAQRRDETRARLVDYLQKHPCVDCPETDIIVLTFDHLRDKEFDIAVAVGRGYGWDKIEKEIEKCVVRCANCHTRKTAKEFGWYKTRV